MSEKNTQTRLVYGKAAQVQTNSAINQQVLFLYKRALCKSTLYC